MTLQLVRTCRNLKLDPIDDDESSRCRRRRRHCRCFYRRVPGFAVAAVAVALALSSTRRAPYPLLLYVNRSADNDIVETFDTFGEFIPSDDAPFSHRLPFLLHVV